MASQEVQDAYNYYFEPFFNKRIQADPTAMNAQSPVLSNSKQYQNYDQYTGPNGDITFLWGNLDHNGIDFSIQDPAQYILLDPNFTHVEGLTINKSYNRVDMTWDDSTKTLRFTNEAGSAYFEFRFSEDNTHATPTIIVEEMAFGQISPSTRTTLYGTQLESSNTGGVAGDPYLLDIHGNLMKLPDKNETYTVFETENKQLKVEMSTSLLNNFQKAQYWNQCKNFFPQLQNKQFARENLLETFNAPLCFIRNVNVTYNNETTSYNLFNKLEECSPIYKNNKCIGLEKTLSFNVEDKQVKLKLQKFSNPQVISGISYTIPKSVNVTGLITDAHNYKYQVITEDFVGLKTNKSITMNQLL